ncbi:cytochrome C assembly protein-domain-containing protein [Ostreococcus tauri]|uniref:Cytochrome C assembly protein-domain-containing protein n=1 Tax=Ostreococcus tauri TaxID=70448 RepID=A0A1Y5ICN8_OSTTA|nr:cytochrome C assembly protein-domain-containing protein [Ostreococcus tauri]
MVFGRATGARAREGATGTRRTTPTRARRRGRARAVRETLELAGALDSVNVDLALSGAEEILGKGAFAATSFAGAVFGSKAIFTEDKRAGRAEQLGMYVANASLFGSLAARWVESGHFPLSNMYESLLFLAWGITAVHLVVTERDGFSKSAIPGALAAPTAALTVAGATLALPTELQRATALVPALKSNWLMMHVSVMMLSYATLLVGSLSCVSYLVVDASQDWAMAKGALEKLDDMVSDGGERARNRPKVSVNADGETVAVDAAASTTNGEIIVDASRGGERILTEMDNLAYRCLGAGFALLTAGLVSGAVWANEAWGSYWSWDPKETWALITWLVYATYLHSRLVAGWSKKDSCAVGAAGFLVVWVCYVGVNLWGVGLHSYGWFANK